MDKIKILEAFPFHNDYLDKYADFIIDRYPDQEKLTDGLFEGHHIFPKSIFGENSYIIRLSYADHFMAHWFLYKAYREVRGIDFRNMCFALVSFLGCPKSRKHKLSKMTDDEIRTVSYLVEYSKLAAKEGTVGELNPFYGKHHSPETIEAKKQRALENGGFYKWTDEHREKYSRYLECRDHYDIARVWYHNPETKINTRLSLNTISSGNIPEGFIEGKYTSDSESLRRSLSIREWKSHNPPEAPKGVDSPHYKSFHYYNPETRESARIKDGLPVPEGFIRGMNISEEKLRERNRKIGDAHRGISKPHMQITNRDPEKIRKTAEKNRGSKRTPEQRANISASLKGMTAHNKGQKLFVNVCTGEKKTFLAAEAPEGWAPVWTPPKNKTIINETTGKKKFIPYDDEIPEGWVKWKKKTKKESLKT